MTCHLAGKFIVVGGCGVLLAGLATLGVDWWSAPIDAAAGNTLTPALFSVRGAVPLAYTVFAFALGVACGVLLRRTLPAMAATLAGFAWSGSWSPSGSDRISPRR